MSSVSLTPKQGEGFSSFLPSLPFLPFPSLAFPNLPLKTRKQSLMMIFHGGIVLEYKI